MYNYVTGKIIQLSFYYVSLILRHVDTLLANPKKLKDENDLIFFFFYAIQYFPSSRYILRREYSRCHLSLPSVNNTFKSPISSYDGW